ncbi:heme-binding protein [bacterium]|nr:heme-binding protein [bacterium]
MKQVKTKNFVLIFAIVTSAAFGQVAEKKGLTIEGAREVITAAVSEAKKLNAPGGVIAVVDEGGNLMALERLDGTFAAGANISVGKARTAALFKRPTKAFEEIIRNGRTPMVALNDFTPLQGGVPIEVDGQIVGAVGVSGASSAQQDEDLAIAGANALKNSEPASGAVTYLDSAKVKAAFSKGMPLLEVGDYKVHASHRDAAGMAEVHVRDTDIIYVLEGSAKFITGGTVIDGKTTEENEIRGASIQGGEQRQLVRGDVIIVPNGTPHWFKEVKGPFNYYVVKVVQ